MAHLLAVDQSRQVSVQALEAILLEQAEGPNPSSEGQSWAGRRRGYGDAMAATAFTYAGPCRELVEHPECGHDHERSADQQHIDAHAQVDLALDGRLLADEAAGKGYSHKGAWISSRVGQYRDEGVGAELALRLAADDWDNKLSTVATKFRATSESNRNSLRKLSSTGGRTRGPGSTRCDGTKRSATDGMSIGATIAAWAGARGDEREVCRAGAAHWRHG